MDGSRAGNAPSDTEVVVASSATPHSVDDDDRDRVTFSNKSFDSWETARKVLDAIVVKNADKTSSLWYRVDVIEEKSGAFSHVHDQL